MHPTVRYLHQLASHHDCVRPPAGKYKWRAKVTFEGARIVHSLNVLMHLSAVSACASLVMLWNGVPAVGSSKWKGMKNR